MSEAEIHSQAAQMPELVTDGSPPEQDSPAIAASEQLYELHLLAPKRIYYAFSHNRIPLVRLLALTAHQESEATQLKIEMALTWSRPGNQPAKPLSFLVDAPTEAGQAVLLEHLPLKLDDAAMVDLEEAVPAVLRVRIERDDGRFQEEFSDVLILARNQWALVPGYEELLASYVQPNHPVTMEVLKEAADLLKERTGSSAIEGYQSGPERAVQIGHAIFDALRKQQINYINPPASFEQHQKVRPLDEVLEAHAGTCIDLACAYASCLEQAGLKPLIWLVPGHAFAGFLLEDDDLGSSVIRDVNQVLNLTDAGLAVAVETIGLTNTLSFEQAREETNIRLLPSAELTVIDVHRAHRSGALPLPARTVRDGIVTIVVDPGPGAAPAVEKRSLATGERIPDSTPLRITRWKSSLLDLSFRNPLINFSTARNGLDILVPRGKLEQLENDLLAGRQLQILPGDKLEGAQTAAGLRSITEVSHEMTVELYEKLNLLYTPSGETEGKKRARNLASRARVLESETGANGLYMVFGKLIWQRKAAGKGMVEVQSPLFLVPVRLIRTRGNALFQVVADDEALTAPNYPLIEKLKADFGLSVPDFERPDLDDSGIDLAASIQALRRGLQERGLPFRVDETAHLAILQYSKFRLWKDMDEHWEKFMDNSVVRHMVENPGVPYSQVAEAKGPELLAEEELAVLCPVPADGAQLRAIARAFCGDSFVLQGPPGTGKSQTITNLLASALAKGKKVLFVAEKQAALSVVRDRLEAVGLGPYFLDLHDKGSKSQEIREQLKQALEPVQHGDDREFNRIQTSLTTLHQRLDTYRAELYRENRQGLSLASAYEEALRLGDGITAEVPATALSAERETLDGVLRALQESEALIDVARPSPEHPWRFAVNIQFEQLDRPALSASLVRLNDALSWLRDAPQRLRQVLNSVHSTTELHDAAVLAEMTEKGWLPSVALMEQQKTATWRDGLTESVQKLRSVMERIDKLKTRLGKAAVERPLDKSVQDLENLENAVKSFFLLRGRNTRKALQQLLATDDVPKMSVEDSLKAGRSLIQTRKRLAFVIKDLKEAAIDELPVDFAPENPESYAVIERWSNGVHAVTKVSRRGDNFAAAFNEALFANGDVSRGSGKHISELRTAIDSFMQLLDVDVQEWDDWLADRELLETLSELVPVWLEDSTENRFLRLKRMIDLASALEPALGLGMQTFVRSILDGEVPAEQAGDAFARGVAAASMRERALVTGLDTFDRVTHGSVIQRYTQALQERQELLKDVIPQMLLASRSFNANARHGEIGSLTVELNKKRNAKSVRQLLADYPDLMQQITPCFLMSPSSAAQFIPPGSMKFDLVVFDEASQIDVAEAIGAMGRAESVIIVGDSKQMPPSRTFSAGTGDDDPLSTRPAEDDEVPEDGESLLDEAVDSVQMDQEWLSWHYRSQDEALIAFSNGRYYDGGLSSFPSPHTGQRTALEWHHVSDGQFTHGRERSNINEAKAVVAEIIRRVNSPSTAGDSIGVVTLNRQQQDEITRQLEESGDARVLELLSADDENSILIRNLENIQGQERDVMLMSTAYSKPAAGGKLPLRFGPLNQQGGERRLNVAVTRARKAMLVFCSFEPEDIDEDRSKALGVVHLREFLEMAKYGPRTSWATAAEREELEHYRTEVMQSLKAEGLEVSADMGLSPFKVDIAVRPMGSPVWTAAILLDGSRWNRRSNPIDRDALPVNVLQGLMGWRTVLRVWLPSWHAEREAVIEELVRTIHKQAEEGEELPQEAIATEADPAGDTPIVVSSAEPETADSAVVVPTIPVSPTADSADASFKSANTTLAEPTPAHAQFVPYSNEEQLGTADSWSSDNVGYRVANSMTATLLKIVRLEGPIELNRLARLVAQHYGVSRLHSSRLNRISSMIPKELVRSGPTGTFIWPENVDPTQYTEFRASDGLRPIEEIAPEEAGNAMAHLISESHSMQHEELVRATADIFGIRRLTAKVSAQFDAYVKLACDSQRIVADGDRYLIGKLTSNMPSVVRSSPLPNTDAANSRNIEAAKILRFFEKTGHTSIESQEHDLHINGQLPKKLAGIEVAAKISADKKDGSEVTFTFTFLATPHNENAMLLMLTRYTAKKQESGSGRGSWSAVDGRITYTEISKVASWSAADIVKSYTHAVTFIGKALTALKKVSESNNRYMFWFK